MPVSGSLAGVKVRSAPLDDILRELDETAPGCALVHLGQSPFWDEPLKSVLANRTDRPIIAGIHDLDYFSRQRLPLAGPLWQVLPRNDGTTRDIWIAAGELSALFGAEVWPSRQALTEAGVRFHRLTHGHPDDPSALDRQTEAWGWRGIVRNGMDSKVICDIPAAEVAPSLVELLEWGAQESAHRLVDPRDRRCLREFAADATDAVQSFVTANRKATLSDLLLHFLKRMYERLAGPAPANVTFETSRRLLRFNRETAALPRFRFVNHFLHERHGPLALEAYARAVEHSGMVDVGAMEPGSLPFDVYMPGRGRGTLVVTPRELRIALPEPVRVPVEKPPHDVRALADALEAALGPDVSLLGKALVLPAMICGEFVMTFTEKGSAYIPRTQLLLAEMGRAGIPLRVNPILRIRLRTWSSLSAIRRTFALPSHLAQAFKCDQITSGQFARHWRRFVREQRELLRVIRDIGSPCELVRHLSQDQHKDWFRRLDDCSKAQKILLDVQRKTDHFRRQATEVRAREDEATEEVRALERRRGDFNRSRLRPLKRKLTDFADATAEQLAAARAEYLAAEREGKALLAALESKLRERKHLRDQRRQIAAALNKIERGARPTAARKLLRETERAAEKARLKLTVNAILVSEGLSYTNVRPSGWWMPAVDPDGAWFRRMARSARFRLEHLAERGT